MDNIQSLLDENKESIPSGLYLQLSNALMKAHISRESGYYRVGYVYCSPCLDEEEFELNIEYEEVIVHLTPRQYRKVDTSIMAKHVSDVHLNSDSEDSEDESDFIRVPDYGRKQSFTIGCLGDFHSPGNSKTFNTVTKCKIVWIKKID